jgi:hypothetical protein
MLNKLLSAYLQKAKPKQTACLFLEKSFFHIKNDSRGYLSIINLSVFSVFLEFDTCLAVIL